jgi:hypothetical protein
MGETEKHGRGGQEDLAVPWIHLHWPGLFRFVVHFFFQQYVGI